jgi:geranyl-CoA carboxylase alpha subunit
MTVQPKMTLLVANRGEIACRIICSARKQGWRTVAVFSEIDRNAEHVRLADEAHYIGPAPAIQSYLNSAAIFAACRAANAHAIHPGYGFLSENPSLADECKDRGIVFVGPTGDAMRALGNKADAKRLARTLKVPCAPGYDEIDQSLGTLRSAAEEIGFPLMIKAAAGGGGRGMRRVDAIDGFDQALAAAQREAQAAFGNDHVLLERLIEGARHIEVQILADHFGNIIHLGDRDCSTQRRQQKIIEEAPAPHLSAIQRETVHQAALTLARAANYTNAGTVEFLLTPEGEFCFLEMNTRLQVEHTVTEAITGLDLVALQLNIAMGVALPISQHDVTFTGHAIQARVCAEHPAENYLPQTGQIERIIWPPHSRASFHEGQARVDSALYEPGFIPADYDSLLAKVVVHAANRSEACRRLDAALCASTVLGIQTNLPALVAVIRRAEFQSFNAPKVPTTVAAQIHTKWLESSDVHATMQAALRTTKIDDDLWSIAAALFYAKSSAYYQRQMNELAGWNNTGRPSPQRMQLVLHSSSFSSSANESTRTFLVSGLNARACRVSAASQSTEQTELQWTELEPSHLTLNQRSIAITNHWIERGSNAQQSASGFAILWLSALGQTICVSNQFGLARPTLELSNSGTVKANMHGKIAALPCAIGQHVEINDLLVVLEAMKMEHQYRAKVSGTISKIEIVINQQVAPGALLIQIDPDAPHA